MRVDCWKYSVRCGLLLTVALLLTAAAFSACARRQTRQSAVAGPPVPVGRISLQDTTLGAGMTELTAPQLEQEKHPDYSFNKAENVFDINVDRLDLRSILQSMCDMMSLNLVMSQGIKDTVTVNLKNVTLFKFLDVVLDKNKVSYRLEDSFLYVSALGLQTRIFNLNYLNTARQMIGTMTIAGQGGGASGGLIPQSTTTLQTQNTINLWNDIINGLQGIVLNKGVQQTAALTAQGSFSGQDPLTGFRLSVEPNSGVIQVTATPVILEESEKYINALESSLQRQVLIEARFVEINLTKHFEAGLDWSVIPDLTSLSNLKGSLTGGRAIAQALNPNDREFQIGVSNQNINTILSAISSNGNVNVLQSPQVSTLNNQPAVIRVARNETFFQRQEVPGLQATATSPATLPVVNYIPVQQPTGVVLNLTPQISDDGQIIMSIRPSITTIASVATSPDGLSTSPITDVRELDTVAKVRHGQTIILAGLIQDRELKTIKETPGLSKLPILGGLFKQVIKDQAKIELVILLTPYINYSRATEELGKTQMKQYNEVAKQYDTQNGDFK
jgi:MSHA biogenesis protein MshL